MAASLSFHSASLLVIFAFVSVLSSSFRVNGGENDIMDLGCIPGGSRCSGSIAECLAVGEEAEFEMDSEVNRRILVATRYISYGALLRGNVPCSLRGASYYNCRAGAQFNPYQRGCSAITRCRS